MSAARALVLALLFAAPIACGGDDDQADEEQSECSLSCDSGGASYSCATGSGHVENEYCCSF